MTITEAEAAAAAGIAGGVVTAEVAVMTVAELGPTEEIAVMTAEEVAIAAEVAAVEGGTEMSARSLVTAAYLPTQGVQTLVSLTPVPETRAL